MNFFSTPQITYYWMHIGNLLDIFRNTLNCLIDFTLFELLQFYLCSLCILKGICTMHWDCTCRSMYYLVPRHVLDATCVYVWGRYDNVKLLQSTFIISHIVQQVLQGRALAPPSYYSTELMRLLIAIFFW